MQLLNWISKIETDLCINDINWQENEMVKYSEYQNNRWLLLLTGQEIQAKKIEKTMMSEPILCHSLRTSCFEHLSDTIQSNGLMQLY